jgi:hypothetical protein
MPTNRKRVGPIRRGTTLDDAWRARLLIGYDPFDGADTRVRPDELELASRLWRLHRHALLLDRSLGQVGPGHRPWAFWAVEHGLERAPWPRGWDWPRGIAGEQHMLHRLVRTGRTEPVEVDEVKLIERQWLQQLGSGSTADQISVPDWFRRRQLH